MAVSVDPGARRLVLCAPAADWSIASGALGAVTVLVYAGEQDVCCAGEWADHLGTRWGPHAVRAVERAAGRRTPRARIPGLGDGVEVWMEVALCSRQRSVDVRSRAGDGALVRSRQIEHKTPAGPVRERVRQRAEAARPHTHSSGSGGVGVDRGDGTGRTAVDEVAPHLASDGAFVPARADHRHRATPSATRAGRSPTSSAAAPDSQRSGRSSRSRNAIAAGVRPTPLQMRYSTRMGALVISMVARPVRWGT